MDSRRLLTFRTVAHVRSFTRAAEILALTQPSVSQQVAQLETELGVRLLDRGSGGLRLTDAGGVLLEHADQVAWRLDLATQQIADIVEGRRDEIRLATFPTAITSFVPLAMLRLRRAHPDARVQLSDAITVPIETRLLSGEVDCALGYQNSDADRREFQSLERVDVMQETFLIALPPGHRLARASGPLSLTDLSDDDWIVPSTEGFLVQACRDAGFEPRVVSTTVDPLATRGFIMRGLGVGWLPSLLAQDYDRVAIRPVKGFTQRRDIYALLPPGRRHPLTPDLIDALVETGRELVAGL